MKTYLSSRILVIIAVAFVLPVIALAEANLTPEQLVLLMKASCEQYDTCTFDTKMKSTSYRYSADNKTSPKLDVIMDTISRWTKKKRFGRIVRTSYADTNPQGYTTISTYALAPKRTKKLLEVSDNRTPRGHIEPRGMSFLDNEIVFCTVHEAMWALSAWPWEAWNLDETTITRDEKNNYYIMKVKMTTLPKGPLITLYIDPSKGFIPVKREFRKYDGTLASIFECSDFRQVENGLWIPYRYSLVDPRTNYETVCEVQEMLVNQPIPDNLLDFEFPNGTVVYDNISNVRYRIPTTTQAQDIIVDPCSVIISDIAVTAPAKEEDLLASALKAKELLQIHIPAKEIVSPAIEVSPTIVLVTADKYKYKLSVKRYDGTKPVLLDYNFEGNGLELSSLKNLIDKEDQLIVNTNRLQSHTGFAKGILVLKFVGENEPVKITFVSAPL